MRSYLDGMLRTFEFSGRSTRMQYWMFFVVQTLVYAAAAAIDVFVLDGFANPRKPQLPISLFVAFVHFVPGITVQVRRLHDLGKSGAWILLYLIPFAGLIVLYWNCCASEPGRNAHDESEPSRYEPYYMQQQARLPRYSTIPRQIRMGSNAGRPMASGYEVLSSPERFI
jgi:uncharacterized membrane protein YhaH (DUF805 family)